MVSAPVLPVASSRMWRVTDQATLAKTSGAERPAVLAVVRVATMMLLSPSPRVKVGETKTRPAPPWFVLCSTGVFGEVVIVHDGRKSARLVPARQSNARRARH